MSDATISPTSPQAWILSFTLHALAIGLIALFTYATRLNRDDIRPVLELVAGPGEDYAAREAPALGSETSVKLPTKAVTPLPTPPAPTPVQPVSEPTPVVPAPAPVVKKEAPKKTPTKKEPDPAKDIAKDLKARVQQADRKAKKQAEVERKKEQARITKEQFDRQNAAKKVAAATPSKAAPTKFTKIDTKGIAAGVVGGSSASKAGAGGKALTREEATLLELYDAEFLLKVRKAYEEERPPGLSDALRATIEVRSNLDGSLSGARITQSSGTPEFDRAVLDAVRRVKMPPRPDKRSETISFVFTMREG